MGANGYSNEKRALKGWKNQRYKARLVVKGFAQREGVDFNEIYSSVVKHTSIRVLLAFVTKYNLKLKQVDVKTAFLHVNLDEIILMVQPEGFVKKSDEGKVCLLNVNPEKITIL